MLLGCFATEMSLTESKQKPSVSHVNGRCAYLQVELAVAATAASNRNGRAALRSAASFPGGGKRTCFVEEVQLMALFDPVLKGHPLKINPTSQSVGGNLIT